MDIGDKPVVKAIEFGLTDHREEALGLFQLRLADHLQQAVLFSSHVEFVSAADVC